MSSIVKTITPFINREQLLQALKDIGCQYEIAGNEILTDRVDRFYLYGKQRFVLENGKYYYRYEGDSPAYRNIIGSDSSVRDFLCKVEKAYLEVEKRKSEEERQRIEQERRDFVEKQRAAITAKAKAKGYKVYEERANEKIKLVLVRQVY